MIAVFMMLACGTIGGAVGNYVFDGATGAGVAIGALVGLFLRFGGWKILDGLADCVD